MLPSGSTAIAISKMKIIMKKSSLLIALMVCSFQMLVAQRGSDNTLFSNSKRFGVFVSGSTDMHVRGPFDLYNVDGGLALNLGDFYFGGYGSIGSEYLNSAVWVDADYMRITQVGLWLGFNPWQRSTIHPFVDMKVGVGEMTIHHDDFPAVVLEANPLTSINGNIGLEINLSSWLRMNAYYGARRTAIWGEQSFANPNTKGRLIGVGLRVGWFGSERRGNGWSCN